MAADDVADRRWRRSGGDACTGDAGGRDASDSDASGSGK